VTKIGGGGCGRRAIVLSIMLAIAALHVAGIGRHLQPHWGALYASYFSDLALPFGVYFLLLLPEPEWPLFDRWETRSFVVFGMAAVAETLQRFGVWALGSTFDPLDYVMYAVGVLVAAFVDTQVMARAFAFWRTGMPSRSS
jgi:hypothetical protein